MTRIVARLLLSMLIVPLGALIYSVTVAILVEFVLGWGREIWAVAIGGSATCLIAAAYWLLLWHRSVKWTTPHLYLTFAAALLCIGTGAGLGYLISRLWGVEMAGALGTGVAIFGWLGLTVLLWQQSPSEAIEGPTLPVVCPTCGYDLSGLQHTRCPECGNTPTLDRLMAAQPRHEPRTLEPTRPRSAE